MIRLVGLAVFAFATAFILLMMETLSAFLHAVKRCAEMSRKLRFLKDLTHKAGLVLSPHAASEPDFELEELEAGDFLMPDGNHSAAQETELDEIVHTNNDYADTASLMEQEMQPGISNQSGVKFVSGVICKSKALRFERMLFRTTRGNMLFNQAPADDPIVDPVSNEMVENTVFIVFFSGEQARKKILKICEAFGANCYPVPEDAIKRRQITSDVLSCLSELETTLEAGLRHRAAALNSIGFQLTKWMNMVRREKAIYDALNMLNFDVTKKCLVGEPWCPVFAKTMIQDALQRVLIVIHKWV